VNALLVGIIESAHWMRRHAGDRWAITWEQWCAEQGKAVPLGRLGTAEEFTNNARFLASDGAGYVTATAITVSGRKSPVV
jgi:NAD(P)-dependent dehydrogenase (short-subunit alcohol dehydrogenase family)